MAGITPYTDESWRRTNADRIRAMTDEELAEWIISITEDLTTRWLDWLKQEVDK